MNRVDKRVFFLPLKEDEKVKGKKERTKRN